jgi:hypothetical protein
MTYKSRHDCEHFEIKTNNHQTGDCQTDGHYLCGNCKRIAPLFLMEESDNMMRYYPEEYKEQIKEEELLLKAREELYKKDKQ